MIRSSFVVLVIAVVLSGDDCCFCEGSTVVIERDAVGGTTFQDDKYTKHNVTFDNNSTTDPRPSCEFAGQIRLSHPMSVYREDKYYVLGSQMLASAHMTIDEINKWPRCGVRLTGGRPAGNGGVPSSSIGDTRFGEAEEEEGEGEAWNYSLHLTTYEDDSSKVKTSEIGRKLASDNDTDFMLAGYSSALTGHLTPIAQEHARICITAGSSKTPVHADRDYVFGLLPPSTSFLEYAFRGTREAGAKTVAFLAEDDVDFVCSGAAQMAKKYQMTLLEGLVLPEDYEPGEEIYGEVARNMSKLDPDVMVTCIHSAGSMGYWNRAMRSVKWTPKAQVYTIVVGTPELERDLGSIDLAYTMGVSSWDKVLPPVPDGATGFTPAEFASAFEQTAFRPPAYQHVAQSAAVSVLVQAVERVGSWTRLTQQSVRDELAAGYFPTVYGNVSFDVNGQSAVPFLLMQYDAKGTLHVLQPEDRVSTDFEMVYPMPTWDHRDCLHLSDCPINGTCTTQGTCRCPAPLLSAGTGKMAACKMPPDDNDDNEDATAALLVSILLPTALIIVAGVAALLVANNNKKQRENDAIWQVKKEELTFGNPPKVIGRGTFGLVLLAEYRGTRVAVKRVLPPRQQATKDGAAAAGGGTGGAGKNQGELQQQKQTLSRSFPRFSLEINIKDKSKKRGSAKPKAQARMVDTKKAMSSWAKASIMNSTGASASASGGAATSTIAGNNNTSFRSTIIAPSGSDDTSSIGDDETTCNDDNDNSEGGDTIATNGGTAAVRGWKQLAKKQVARESALYRKLRADFIQEMRYVSKLRHPCITMVIGAVISQIDEPMLIMEYMEHGSLHDLLHNETMLLDGETILQLLQDVSQGCRFLHAAEPLAIIHGDLKAANILVDRKFRAKVADFGLSQKKRVGDATVGGATGTPFWMSPELLRGESSNTVASDVYSFGIILYEVFSRRDPYDDEQVDAREILRMVKDPNVNKRPPVPRNCPSQMAALMSDCLVANPAARPSFEEVDQRLQRVHAETTTAEEVVAARPGGKGLSTVTRTTDKTTVSLFDIFPRHIAEALRDGKQVEPEHRDVVTIFFSDIVGFTTLSSTLEPRKVANLLDRLYQKFDELSQEHDIFKVETIGDAYMAVTNLVKDQSDDHVKRIAEFAVRCVRAANETLVDTDDIEKGSVNIRVGIHSGPVVADVVGTRNPRYCLFGDSVNVASRMESNSSPNRIHCSKSSAALLKKQHPGMPLKYRGMIEVKGKGEMGTYWVNEGLDAAPLPAEEPEHAPVPAQLDHLLDGDVTDMALSHDIEQPYKRIDHADTDAPATPEAGPIIVVGGEARSKMRDIEATFRDKFGGLKDIALDRNEIHC